VLDHLNLATVIGSVGVALPWTLVTAIAIMRKAARSNG